MTLTSNQLLNRLYFDRPFTEVARIVGYAGVELPAFWAATKSLGIPQAKLLDAVYELTRPDKREGTPPRYELREDVKHLCWQLLGPPPEKEGAFWRHPDGTPMERPKPVVEEVSEAITAAEPEKKRRKQRGKGR